MATPQSSLVIKNYNGFGGNFVDSQYLAAAYETGKPHIFENMLMRIFSSNSLFTKGKLITELTGGKQGGTTEIDTEVYRWRLQGAEEKSARSVENLEPSNTAPGIGNTSFRIKLDLNYYSAPEVLFSEDNDVPLAIVEGPIADGTGFIYVVKIQNESPTAFLDPKYLESGREFNKVWTSVQSEYNGIGGGQQYPNIFMLEGQVSAFAQKLTITDKAWRDQGRLGFEFSFSDRNGKQQNVSKFLPMAEAKMWDELYQSMEAQMVYGKRTTTQGQDGYWIKTGAGMREQLKDSWIQYYNGALTVNMMKDYLLDIFVSRKNQTQRRTVAITGTLGSTMFHDALAAIANGFLTVDTHYIGSIPSPVETPYLSYGAQFKRYLGPEGIVIDLHLNSMYDSRDYCKRMHPQYPNLPVDSARMTFLDFGSEGGENNISMLKVKDTFRWGYVAGSHTPTGPVKGGMAGSFKAGYDMFTEGTAGLLIRDVTRCGELIYDFEF